MEILWLSAPIMDGSVLQESGRTIIRDGQTARRELRSCGLLSRRDGRSAAEYCVLPNEVRWLWLGFFSAFEAADTVIKPKFLCQLMAEKHINGSSKTYCRCE